MKNPFAITIATSLILLASRLIAGDLLDTPQRLTVVGSPIMGNVSILWMDLLNKKYPDFGGIHVGQPPDSEVFNLRHGHVDAIFLNRKLSERDIKFLGEHAGKAIELNVGESVKNGYQVYMYFWDKGGKIDLLLERFLEAAASDAGAAISDGEGKYLRVHTDKIRAYLVARKQTSEQASTGQPATRPESKSEGGDKPQPDEEGRSR